MELRYLKICLLFWNGLLKINESIFCWKPLQSLGDTKTHTVMQFWWYCLLNVEISISLKSYGGKSPRNLPYRHRLYNSDLWPPLYKGTNKGNALSALLQLMPIVHKPLPSLCNWKSACWPCMLHWFRYLKPRLSAFIKMRRVLGGCFDLTGLTPDTRYLPPCARVYWHKTNGLWQAIWKENVNERAC